MKTITRICQECNKEFLADIREINRGNAKVCSRTCAHISMKKKSLEKAAMSKEPNTKCSYCGIQFYKSKSKRNGSRSGLFFCCRQHKDLAQKIVFGLSVIQPQHYGEHSKNYRKTAMDSNELTCSLCLYSKHPEILEVHHIDRDKTNNSIENLIILCPNCHMEEHFLNKDGRWKFAKPISAPADSPK